jgi:hypothetical protein
MGPKEPSRWSVGPRQGGASKAFRTVSEEEFCEVQHSLDPIPMSVPDLDLRPWGYYFDCDVPATRRWL